LTLSSSNESGVEKIYMEKRKTEPSNNPQMSPPPRLTSMMNLKSWQNRKSR